MTQNTSEIEIGFDCGPDSDSSKLFLSYSENVRRVIPWIAAEAVHAISRKDKEDEGVYHPINLSGFLTNHYGILGSVCCGTGPKGFCIGGVIDFPLQLVKEMDDATRGKIFQGELVRREYFDFESLPVSFFSGEYVWLANPEFTRLPAEFNDHPNKIQALTLTLDKQVAAFLTEVESIITLPHKSFEELDALVIQR